MAIDITRPDLVRFLPDAKDATIDAILSQEDWLDAEGLLETDARWCHFMAQVAHESTGFTRFEESLNYRSARLCEVFPRHFPTIESTAPFARNPEALANYVYADANRNPTSRLGNTQPGDGWTFRGRGPIQLTGREAYTKFGKLSGLPLVDTPDLALDPANGVRIAALNFIERGCLKKADTNDLTGITKAINGGKNGLASRAEWLRKARAIWGPASARSTRALIEKSSSVQAGGGTLVVAGGAAIAKGLTEGPDPLTTLRDAGASASAIKTSLDPMLNLWHFLTANFWPGVAVCSLGTVVYLLYRRWLAHKEGTHV